MSPQKLLDEALAAAEIDGHPETLAFVNVGAAITQALVALTAEIHEQNELVRSTRF